MAMNPKMYKIPLKAMAMLPNANNPPIIPKVMTADPKIYEYLIIFEKLLIVCRKRLWVWETRSNNIFVMNIFYNPRLDMFVTKIQYITINETKNETILILPNWIFCIKLFSSTPKLGSVLWRWSNVGVEDNETIHSSTPNTCRAILVTFSCLSSIWCFRNTSITELNVKSVILKLEMKNNLSITSYQIFLIQFAFLVFVVKQFDVICDKNGLSKNEISIPFICFLNSASYKQIAS